MFIGAVLYGPLLILVVFSFNDSIIIALPLEGFTTKWYQQVFSDPLVIEALKNSIIIAAGRDPGLHRPGDPGGRGDQPVPVHPACARGRAGGCAARGAVAVDRRRRPAVLQPAARALSLQTIGVMQVVSIFPLVTAIVAARLVRFDTSLEEAARDLGATQWEVLRYIVLPLIAPALAAAAIFAFSWSFNNFTISYFTGGLPVDVPDLGVLDAEPREERADRERDLDARCGRASRDPVRGLAAQPPLAVADR